MRLAFTILALILLMAACDGREISSSETSAGPDVHQVAKDYRLLTSMTKQPAYVDPNLAMLCSSVPAPQVAPARPDSTPPTRTAVSIYMNDPAASAFAVSTVKYPVGSVIVKEKTGLPYAKSVGDEKEIHGHAGVGGMIKRAPGYDTSHGDWEYFYFEDPGKIENGKIASCIQCHSGAASRDYVFGSWADRSNDLGGRAQ